MITCYWIPLVKEGHVQRCEPILNLSSVKTKSRLQLPLKWWGPAPKEENQSSIRSETHSYRWRKSLMFSLWKLTSHPQSVSNHRHLCLMRRCLDFVVKGGWCHTRSSWIVTESVIHLCGKGPECNRLGKGRQWKPKKPMTVSCFHCSNDKWVL